MAEEKKEIIKIPEYQMETKNLTLSKYDYSEVQQNVISAHSRAAEGVYDQGCKGNRCTYRLHGRAVYYNRLQ